MGVKFDLGGGTSAYVEENGHFIDTDRGLVRADMVMQGDFICNVSKQPRNEVMSPPVVT